VADEVKVRLRQHLGYRGSCQVLSVEADGVNEIWVVDQFLWNRQQGRISPGHYHRDWVSRVALVRMGVQDYRQLVELGVIHEGLRAQVPVEAWLPTSMS
jgi:hypothetical protein